MASRPATLIESVGAVFAGGGVLAQRIPGYEPRQGQHAMAAAVADTLEHGGTLLAEAGTGTGKTLAYLIPAILSGRRALISTGTKNLQEQIFFKDIPALQQALGATFTATLMKGRSNYLCLHRWELYRDGVEGNLSAHGRLIESGDRVLLPVIDRWLKETRTGDRAELRDLPEDLPLWKEVAAEADTCLGPECPRHGECFVTLMRQRAAESDVVIANHHLLCADAAVRASDYGEVIPGAPALIVDEAHQLEEVATQYFGITFSSFRIDDLVHDAGRLLAAGGPHGAAGGAAGERALAHGLVLDITEALARLQGCSRVFFAGLSESRAATTGAGDTRARYTAEAIADHVEDGMELSGALEALETALAIVNVRTGGAPAGVRDRSGPDAMATQASDTVDTPRDEAAAALERRAAELRSQLRFLLRADDPDFVYFIETRGRGLFMRAARIDVSTVVREQVLDRFRSVVLTSATLAVDQRFDYVKGRLGISDASELRVASEFDYAAQALLYLPRRMPAPRAPAFGEAAAREVIEILKRSRGRAFVLFTSYAVMHTVRRFVEMALPYPILVQGTAPRSTLIEEFRRTPHAVLLGTSSFWQGVDVVGDALSCVIIDKLPFASPADPVTAARIDAVRAAGGDPFSDYQVPLAILQLQQGLGRLVRHRADRGVLAILDPRLRTMGYGRRFLASLPAAPVTHDLDAVEQFFK